MSREVTMEASTEKIQKKLADWVEEGHAMEQRALRELDVTLSALQQETRWPAVEELGAGELLALFQEHRADTERHEKLLRERLDALGRSPSRIKEAKSVIAGVTASFIESAGADKPARHAQDAFAVEHREIAFYQLLSAWLSAPATARRLAWRAPTAAMRRSWRASSHSAGTACST
jgi:ferritin-like metal-binding protein YciE